MNRIFSGFIAALILSLAAPAMAEAINTGHLKAELVTKTAGAAPGSTVYLAVRQQIDKGWHTYWRNPGDSGDATKIVWTLPAGWSAGDIVWPVPSRLPLGPLMNYGYQGEVLLTVPVTVPANSKVGSSVTIKAAVAFLVCADVCVPESAVLNLALPIVAAPANDPNHGLGIEKALADKPKPAGLTASYIGSATGLTLAVAGSPLAGADMNGAYFFPYSGVVMENAAAQTIEKGPNGLTLTLKPGTAFVNGPTPDKIAGVLAVGGKTYEIEAASGPAPAGTSGLGPATPATSNGPKGVTNATPAAGQPGLLLAIVFAFIGGMILNLMPCVFPVLSMKAASLASHASEPKAARAEGLAFMGGVLLTFLALAGALMAARAAGGAVGWGFQLQSPAVVAVLCLVMLLTALNLSGLFEIGTSVQGVGSGLASKDGLLGAAFTGALAVVVAAPCTAPFMAPALGVALTQPPILGLAVFLSLGLGMAAPFTALAFAPGLLKRIPRPGAWMETFRRVLAFPMYAAAAWLVWVLAQQTDSAGLARLLAIGVLTAFGAWLYGRSQGIEGRKYLLLMTGGTVLLSIAMAGAMIGAYAPAPSNASGSGPKIVAGGLEAETYSADRLAELRGAGVPVLVDFTAAWCVTCQVNERTTLANPKVVEAFGATNTVYMKADWTNQNAEISKILSDHGRAGVQLYLLYSADGSEKILPQLLTPRAVIAALKTSIAA